MAALGTIGRGRKARIAQGGGYATDSIHYANTITGSGAQPGSYIIVTNEGDSMTRTTVTGAGTWTVYDLPPGTYFVYEVGITNVLNIKAWQIIVNLAGVPTVTSITPQQQANVLYFDPADNLTKRSTISASVPAGTLLLTANP